MAESMVAAEIEPNHFSTTIPDGLTRYDSGGLCTPHVTSADGSLMAGHGALLPPRNPLAAAASVGSNSTPNTVAFPDAECSAWNCWRSGISVWQGPHQLAKKLTNTHLPCNVARFVAPLP